MVSPRRSADDPRTSPPGNERKLSPAAAAGARAAAPPIASGGTAAPAASTASVQRVIMIGHPESGKSAAIHVVFGAPPPPEHGHHHSARPGHPAERKQRLRSAVVRDARDLAAPAALLDDGVRSLSRGNFLRNRDGLALDNASIAGSAASPNSSAKYTLINADVTDVAIGTSSLLPIEVLELRDSDAHNLAADRVFGRDVLTDDTKAVIITVDVSTLVARPVTVKRATLEQVMQALRPPKAKGDAPPVVVSRAPPPPLSERFGGAGAAVSQLPQPGAAGQQSEDVAELEAADEERLRNYFVQQVEAALDAADSDEMELQGCIRTARLVVEAVHRHHTCAPAVRIVVAITKCDLLPGIFKARQAALLEARRLGTELIAQRAEILKRARGDDVTILVNRSAVPTSAAPARPLDDAKANAAAKDRLASLQRRIAAGIAAPPSNESLALSGGSDPTSERTAGLSLTRQESSKGLRPPASTPPKGSSAGSATGPRSYGSASGRTWMPLECEVVALSAITDGGDSIVHFFNNLTGLPFEISTRLTTLLESLRRNCRLLATTFVDLHSGIILAGDTMSLSRLPAIGRGNILAAAAKCATNDPQLRAEEIAKAACDEDARLYLGSGGERAPQVGELFGSAKDRAPSCQQQLFASSASPSSSAAPSPAPAVRERSGSAKRASFAVGVKADDERGSASICVPKGQSVVPWRWRRAMRMSKRLARAATVSAAGHHHPPALQGDLFTADIETDDGNTLLIRGLTKDHLCLVACVATTEHRSNPSLVDFNVEIVRRAVTDLATRPSAAAASTGAASSQLNAQAAKGEQGPARKSKAGLHARIVSPKLSPR
jgi:hypothetical protein